MLSLKLNPFLPTVSRKATFQFTLFLFALLYALQTTAQSTTGQNQTLSPYSNFGIGEWSSANFLQIAGANQTRSGAYTYSLANPATLGNLYYTTLDMGARANTGTLSANDQSRTFNGGGISYVSLAFRTWNYYKRKVTRDSLNKIKTYKSTRFATNSALTLKPLSGMGYQYAINNTSPFPSKTTHSGGGGVNLLESSHALRLGNTLSLGYSAGWVFGTLIDQSLFYIPDSTNFRYVEDYRTVQVRGMQQKAGLLLNFKTDTLYHSIGASLQWFNSLNGSQERLVRSMYLAGGYLNPEDTILKSSLYKQPFTLPLAFGLGYSVRYKQKLTLNVDYKKQLWSSNSSMFFDANRTYVDRSEAGISLIINPLDSRASGKKKMPWPIRLGASNANTQYQFNGSNPTGIYNINEQRAFIGVGIPFVRRYFDNTALVSMVNLQIDYLKRSPKPFNNSLATEEYLNFTIAVQLGDVWFQRRKFD